MEFEEGLFLDFSINLSEEHLNQKEKRFRSMERQKHHRGRLLNELSCSHRYKPSIWRDVKLDEHGDYIYTNRVKRNKNSKMQKQLKKASCRKIRHLPNDTIPHKGNHYKKVFDYWWNWI